MSASTRTRITIATSLAAAVASASGCNLGRSCDFGTDAINIVAEVVDDGVTVRAEASFKSGRGAYATPVELCDDDTLTINGEDPVETFKLDRVVYSVTHEVADAPRDYVFELDRGARDEVIEVRSTLPPTFEILTPMADEMVSRAADVLVTWEPSAPDGEMQIEIEEDIGGGLCIVTATPEHDYKRLGGIRVPDDGNWTIPAGALSSDAAEPCEASYALTRTAIGDYPEAFEPGGFVEARLRRSVAVVSTP